MSVISEISDLILRQSKFTESHLRIIDKEALLERVAGKAGIDTDAKRSVAKFILLLTNELKQKSNLINSETDQIISFTSADTRYSYESTDMSEYGHTTLLSKFLNTYDKNGDNFKPLLQRLENNSGQSLSTIIFDELQKVHNEWINVYENADAYLRLQLNYVDPDEINSIQSLIRCGEFNRLTDDRLGFIEDVINPACYEKKTSFNHDNIFEKSEIAERITGNYSKSLDFVINLTEELHLISTDDRYYVIGIDDKNKFTFRKLDDELDIHGYTFEFDDLEKDKEKAESLRTMIEMSLAETSLKRKTSIMKPYEALTFSIEYICEANNIYNGDYRFPLPLEENKSILSMLSSNDINNHNKLFSFSEESKEYISGFIETMRLEHFDTSNLYAISTYIHNHGANTSQYYCHDELDLICPITEVSNHSHTVNVIKSLILNYESDTRPMAELLKVAKSLDSRGLELLEMKLKLVNIDIKQFEKDLKTKNKLESQYPF